MRARTAAWIGLWVVAALLYAAFIGYKGVLLVAEGSVVPVLLGLAVLVVPVLGLVLIGAEVRFGRRCARLAAELEAEQGLPVDDLPRRPSGRVDRDAADEQFAAMRAETERAPQDWRSWFRLALAYDLAGDRTRGRAAARHALNLHAAA